MCLFPAHLSLLLLTASSTNVPISSIQLTSFSFEVKRVSQQPYSCGDDDAPRDDYASSFRSHFLDPAPSNPRISEKKKDAVLWEV